MSDFAGSTSQVGIALTYRFTRGDRRGLAESPTAFETEAALDRSDGYRLRHVGVVFVVASRPTEAIPI